MPPVDEHAVPVLRVGAADRSFAFYRRLGFEVEWEHRFEPGFPVFASVRRGPWHLFLSEHTGDAPPDGLAYFVAEDVDALWERWRAAGIEAPPPEDRPWGAWSRRRGAQRARYSGSTRKTGWSAASGSFFQYASAVLPAALR